MFLDIVVACSIVPAISSIVVVVVVVVVAVVVPVGRCSLDRTRRLRLFLGHRPVTASPCAKLRSVSLWEIRIILTLGL
jgi:hypothetical protein